MKPSELIPVLKKSLEKNWPMLIVSSPGCGKSEIGTQVVKELEYDFMIKHPVIEDVTDPKGLPALVNGKADFLPYGDLRQMMETTRPLAVMIDDLGQAPQSLQAAY